MNRRLLLLLTLLGPATLAVAATPASRLFAAVSMTKAQRNSPTPLDSGLYVRDAAGQWTLFGPRILGVVSVTQSPSHPEIMLLASADGVVRTADGGRTWRKTTGWEVADVRGFAYDAGNPDRIYAATAWGPLRSADGGATWELAQAGLDRLYCQTLVADVKQSGRVLLGLEHGLAVSTDGAHSWRRVDFPDVTVLRLVQSAADPRLLLATTEGRGAWLSHDGGATWAATDPGSAHANLYTATISPQDPTRLAVGGWGTGVRVSADGGATWTDRSAGLPVRNVFVVAFDPDVRGRLWASTFEEGTFYSDDLGATWHDGGLYGAYAYDFIFLPGR